MISIKNGRGPAVRIDPFGFSSQAGPASRSLIPLCPQFRTEDEAATALGLFDTMMSELDGERPGIVIMDAKGHMYFGDNLFDAVEHMDC